MRFALLNQLPSCVFLMTAPPFPLPELYCWMLPVDSVDPYLPCAGYQRMTWDYSLVKQIMGHAASIQ
ncbi:hypothetical protein PAXRUDRAFT_375533 [Paxillus rubicundulus Ve08.2h10]|uniref:Uncharacterized protein n=1 Tax=Paxillus rubicundulus Ve08.2h10 TaxID=930991 RepID=A0A0D0DRF2_9AGAM|nr:hypothetical protein PAXRUDRAFT_375533 [Paxillus rubicundulus Ve08.2h10]